MKRGKKHHQSQQKKNIMEAISLYNFNKKYSILNYDYETEPSFEDSVLHSERAVTLLKEVFPLITNYEIDLILMGVRLDRYNAFGGYGGFYAQAAINALIEGCEFYLKTGWLQIGLDKCAPISQLENDPKLSYQRNHDGHIYDIRATMSDNIIIADTSGGYKQLLFNDWTKFVDALQKLSLDEGFAKIGQFKIECEDIEAIKDGFSAVDSYEILERFGLYNPKFYNNL